jgi:hypothetical protein
LLQLRVKREIFDVEKIEKRRNPSNPIDRGKENERSARISK